MIRKVDTGFRKEIMLKRKIPACMPWRSPRGKGGQARSRTAAKRVASRVTPNSCSANA
jgi:hypothetical protein